MKWNIAFFLYYLSRVYVHHLWICLVRTRLTMIDFLLSALFSIFLISSRESQKIRKKFEEKKSSKRLCIFQIFRIGPLRVCNPYVIHISSLFYMRKYFFLKVTISDLFVAMVIDCFFKSTKITRNHTLMLSWALTTPLNW